MTVPRSARQTFPRSLPRARAKLTAVVPAYNEAGSLEALISELQALSFRDLDFEFVVIDDGSSDRTREVARAAGARVVSLPFNMGIGMAVQTGFRFALAHGASLVVQVDGDGQHVPGEIEKLLPRVLSGEADVVVGSRFSRGKAPGIDASTPARWLAGRLLSAAIRLLTGRRITDTTSGFRVYSREAAELVVASYPDDYPEVQVLVALAGRGFRIEETHVRMRSRASGRSSINWSRAIYYVIKVSFASFMDRVRR